MHCFPIVRDALKGLAFCLTMALRSVVLRELWYSGVSGRTGRADLHIKFGESVSEALSDLGEKNSCCDHANRDEIINVGF